MDRAVAYYRVSTRQQQRSGLGIEAQRAAVERFAEAENLAIIAEFIEAETGKGADALDRRPQLAAALATARQAKCPILVSKLDRLTSGKRPKVNRSSGRTAKPPGSASVR